MAPIYDSILYLDVIIVATSALSFADALASPHGHLYVYRSPQRAGTCYFRCVQESLRYLSLRMGLTMPQYRTLKFALRSEMMCMALHDLGTEPSLGSNDVHLLGLGQRILAYNAVRMARMGALTAR